MPTVEHKYTFGKSNEKKWQVMRKSAWVHACVSVSVAPFGLRPADASITMNRVTPLITQYAQLELRR